MRHHWILVPVLALSVGLFGCGKSKDSDRASDRTGQTEGDVAEQQAQQQNEPAPGGDRQAAETRPSTGEESRGSQPSGGTHREDRPARPAPVVRDLAVPAGHEIVASLQSEISTKQTKSGETFTALTKEPVRVEGYEAIPAGSTLHGEVVSSQRAPRLGGRAKITLQFSQIVTPGGESFAIGAEPLHLEGQSTTSGDIQKVLGGAVGGTVIGGILGGKKGAGKGAAAGAAAGGVIAVATRGKDIVLPPGTAVSVTLTAPLHVPVTVASGELP